MKERHLSGGFSYEGVVGVSQSWEEVSAPAFPDHGMKFLVGPHSLSISEGIAEGLGGLVSVGWVDGGPYSGMGGGALFVPPG